MSKILVTGSRGTIGVPLVKKLKERGHQVYECDLQHCESPNAIRADVGNYRQVENIFRVFGDMDVVYHLAAEFGRHNGEEYYEQLWQTNAIGTKNILELQKKCSFGRLVFISSSEVYGNQNFDVLNEEIMDNNPVIQHNDYAISKWVNEKQIMNHIALTGLPVFRVRLFNAYGPGEYYHPFRSVICLFVYRALTKQPYTVYKGYKRVFMYIDDLIPTLSNIVDSFIPNCVVNIGGTEFREIKEASDLILDMVNGDRSLVQYLQQDAHNTVNKNPDITKAIEILGHNPVTTLEEGLPKTIQWMKSVYGL